MNKYNFCGHKYEDIKERIESFFHSKNIRILSNKETINLECCHGRVNVACNDDGYITDIWEG